MASRHFAQRHPRAFACVIAVLAVLSGLWGAAGLANAHDMKAHGVTTTATVVSLHTGKAFYYTVRFSLPNGRTITADTGEANDKSVLVDGDPIRVEYLPEDPTDVDQVGTLGPQSIIWTGFVVFGLLLFVVAVALLTPLRHFFIRGSTVAP